MRGASIGSILVLCVVLTACSLVNDPEEFIADPVRAEDFCNEYARLRCDVFVSCCSSEIDRDACVDLISTSCAGFSFGQLVVDDRTGYNAPEAGYQLAQGRVFADSCDESYYAWSARLDGLTRALQGTVGEGGDCSATPGFTEVFTPPELVRLDAPRFLSCMPGLACLPVSTFAGPWTCQPRPTSGEPCAGLSECTTDVICVVNATATAATCLPRLAVGSPCDTDNDCATYMCRESTCVALSDMRAHCDFR